jgi:ABC-type branched-subunit amino acid transport system permease subunit
VINIYKLVLLDILLHGKRFILIEFLGGSLLGFIFSILFYRSQNLIICLLFLGLGVNYLALSIYAIKISSNKKLVPDKNLLEYSSREKYTLQSFMVIIPFAVAILALLQQLKKVS